MNCCFMPSREAVTGLAVLRWQMHSTTWENSFCVTRKKLAQKNPALPKTGSNASTRFYAIAKCPQPGNNHATNRHQAADKLITPGITQPQHSQQLQDNDCHRASQDPGPEMPMPPVGSYNQERGRAENSQNPNFPVHLIPLAKKSGNRQLKDFFHFRFPCRLPEIVHLNTKGHAMQVTATSIVLVPARLRSS
jgi:hypothetical protein